MSPSKPGEAFKIMVGVDFSDTAGYALVEALGMAQRRAPAELHLAAVLDKKGNIEVPDAGDLKLDINQAIKSLKRFAVLAFKQAPTAPADGMPVLFTHVRVGSPVRELVAQAAEIGADVLVVGTHGRRGFQDMWLGSVAERIVRLAHCPVLVVRPKDHPAQVAGLQPEPPCEECVAMRRKTSGQTWWCARHAEPSAPIHTYRYSSVFDYTADPYNKVW